MSHVFIQRKRNQTSEFNCEMFFNHIGFLQLFPINKI